MPAPLVSIIDDNADMQIALVHLVRSMGLDARGYGSAVDFLEWGACRTSRCIVTDITMPALSGIDLKHALDALGITTPVIMITAHRDPALHRRATASAPFRILTKPFDAGDFVRCIESAIGPR